MNGGKDPDLRVNTTWARRVQITNIMIPYHGNLWHLLLGREKGNGVENGSMETRTAGMQWGSYLSLSIDDQWDFGLGETHRLAEARKPAHCVLTSDSQSTPGSW